ncbi:MAG: ankyrin repeat domain-containing protein [Planctomycetota bacterium]|jgi:ankyrin repeat protein
MRSTEAIEEKAMDSLSLRCASVAIACLLAVSTVGADPLHEAAASGDLDRIRQLVDHGADIDARYGGGTPLHRAILERQEAAAALLIETGADVDAVGDFGRTPLHIVALRGLGAIADLLIAEGATVDARDQENVTPLGLAVAKGDMAVAAEATALHGVAHAGNPDHHREITELLIAKGAEVDASTRRERNTPLHMAAVLGNFAVADVLVASGANVAARDAFDHQPLHNAAMAGNVKVVELMIDSGADVSARDDLELTPLHWAAAKGRIKRVILPDVRAMIPPELRSPEDHISVVTLLLENGADANAKARKGRTPLRVAANGRISKILEEAVSSSTLAFTEIRTEDLNSRSMNRRTIAYIPTIVDYYLGAPNLEVMKANKKGLFDNPAIFRQRLDEEAERIRGDIDLVLAEEFRRRGCTVKLIEPPQYSQEEIANQQSHLGPVLKLALEKQASKPAQAQEIPDPVSSHAADIAKSTTADLVLVARFWGWRRDGISIPVMGEGFPRFGGHLLV